MVLLEAGADPNYPKQNSGATGLMILAARAVRQRGNEQAIRLLGGGDTLNTVAGAARQGRM